VRNARGTTADLEALDLLHDLGIGTTRGNRQLLGVATRPPLARLSSLGKVRVKQGVHKCSVRPGRCVKQRPLTRQGLFDTVHISVFADTKRVVRQGWFVDAASLPLVGFDLHGYGVETDHVALGIGDD
jgi:hypothetical protein